MALALDKKKAIEKEAFLMIAACIGLLLILFALLLLRKLLRQMVLGTGARPERQKKRLYRRQTFVAKKGKIGDVACLKQMLEAYAVCGVSVQQYGRWVVIRSELPIGGVLLQEAAQRAGYRLL
jgi:hypothetical protein